MGRSHHSRRQKRFQLATVGKHNGGAQKQTKKQHR
ncbi:unnamed protein product [Acanthoscelides obtectus]|uniref:Uncharacterized protein n=1 Tax=Acanthoscelides obtectus TaxID=200917 RepID=A0A9P0L6R6_ACAOB|nr:unnamed protein product [Acanthoscelides obtectus]CAK1637557.1 hypothetical protein AOBTE_LOCUS10047 [Acanthoscelides obtectus]